MVGNKTMLEITDVSPWWHLFWNPAPSRHWLYFQILWTGQGSLACAKLRSLKPQRAVTSQTNVSSDVKHYVFSRSLVLVEICSFVKHAEVLLHVWGNMTHVYVWNTLWNLQTWNMSPARTTPKKLKIHTTFSSSQIIYPILYLEAIEIKKHSNNFIKYDSVNLESAWLSIIDRLRKKDDDLGGWFYLYVYASSVSSFISSVMKFFPTFLSKSYDRPWPLHTNCTLLLSFLAFVLLLLMVFIVTHKRNI